MMSKKEFLIGDRVELDLPNCGDILDWIKQHELIDAKFVVIDITITDPPTIIVVKESSLNNRNFLNGIPCYAQQFIFYLNHLKHQETEVKGENCESIW
jgi:hypothetical protein